MTANGDSFPGRPLTIGDLLREASLAGYSRRQLEYAIERSGIRPIGRVGIIRIFRVEQLPQILEALRRTSRRGSRNPNLEVRDVSRRSEQ